METELKVMVVDDTAVYRHILTRSVEQVPGCRVIGAAANGQIALAKMAREVPNLVLLDCEMPVMNGLETLREIKRLYPNVVVVMVSGANHNAAALTFEALQLGAVEFIPKPEGTSLEDSQRLLGERLRHVCEVSQQLQSSGLSSTRAKGGGIQDVSAVPSPGIKTTRTETVSHAAMPQRPVKAIVIGISTGGPTALAHMLPLLPADLPVPVLIVQHMPTYFTSCLAKSLSKSTLLPVVEGEAGMEVTAGRIYLAPGGRHMVLRRGPKGAVIDLHDGAQVKNCRPSADVLFESAGELFGGSTLAVVMTGMGDDGCDGVGLLKRKGARCITQSAATCTIYGMPRAVDEHGYSDESLPLERIAARIAELTVSERRVA